MSSSTAIAPARSATRDLAQIAVFAALIVVLGLPGQLTIGSAGVPITLQTLGVMLAGSLLGWRKGALSVLAVMIIGLSSSVVFFSVQKGVEKTHPGPLKVSYSENDPQVKGSSLALGSLEAIEAKSFFAKIEENLRVLKKESPGASKVGEADEILEKLSETKELIRGYCLLVKKMALNLGDIDLLVKQINNRIAISNFNYPIAKHIETLGQRLGVVLKKNANTLLLLASMLFVAALGDICRIIIVS